MEKKVFISGIAGFLGSHLADRMLQHGFTVIGCDNLVGGNIDNIPSEVDFYKVDCGNLDAMRTITEDCGIIYHTACTPYEGLSLFSPNLITQNTFQITSTLLSAAAQNRVSRFVYCSSMARYGRQDELPLHEEMKCRPVEPYGIAKYAAELLVKNICEVHGIEYVIAIPHNIIGPRQKYDDPYRNVAAIMINLMLQGRQPVIYGDGTNKRCFSYIDDVIFCLEQLGLSDKVIGETFNIGPDEGFISIYQLTQLIAEKLQFSLDPIFVPARPQEISLATCSARKAREILGYETRTSLDEGISRLIEYIRSKGTKKFSYHLEIEIRNEICPRTWLDEFF